MSYVKADLTAENTFTDWIEPKEQLVKDVVGFSYLDFMATGSWAGTLTVQKRHGNVETSGDVVYTDVFDVVGYDANTCKLIEDHSSTVQYRVGFKTGGYVSGTASVRLEQ